MPSTLPLETLLHTADAALRTVFAPHRGHALPGDSLDGSGALDGAEKRHAGALMRVNHVGEVCAQALYTGQALMAGKPELRAHLIAACEEETAHLAWTEARMQALGARPSVLNPLWYAGAFGIGVLAGALGERVSLGFVVETEEQVGAHLRSHLDSAHGGLPQSDSASRAVVAQMEQDELRHARQARAAGAMELPAPAKALMRLAGKVMTTVAHRV